MTPLRQRITQDMQVRNLSPRTQATYILQVSLLARHFHAVLMAQPCADQPLRQPLLPWFPEVVPSLFREGYGAQSNPRPGTAPPNN